MRKSISLIWSGVAARDRSEQRSVIDTALAQFSGALAKDGMGFVASHDIIVAENA